MSTHTLKVTGDGMLKVAAKRNDLCKLWVHRGTDGWMLRPDCTAPGTLVLDNGFVEMRVPKGSTEDFRATTGSNNFTAMWSLFDELSDAEVSYLSVTGAYDVTAEAGGAAWGFTIFAASSMYAAVGAGSTALVGVISTSPTPATSSYAATFTPPAGTKVILVTLYCGSDAHTTTAEKYVRLAFEIYSSGLTSKVRLDEAAAMVATAPGLAVSATTKPVGPLQDHLVVGEGTKPTNAWAALEQLEQTHSQPVTNRFTLRRGYEFRPRLRTPDDPGKVVVVGGRHPGLPADGWQIDETGAPDEYCEVIFGNKDDTTLPEAWPRRIVRPCEPPDENVRMVTLDLSDQIHSDVNAMARGDFRVGRSAAPIPPDYIFRAHAEFARGGQWPNDNADLVHNGSWQDVGPSRAVGTLHF